MTSTPITLLQKLCTNTPTAEQPGSWTRFIELFTPLLLNWGKRLGLQPNDAADLAQDVFTKLLRELPRFDLAGLCRKSPLSGDEIK